jgi:GAF domain-containing protein
VANQEALSEVLRRFARTMAGSYDIADVLHELSDNVVEVLGATAAGVALCDKSELRFVTATSAAAIAAEQAQEQTQSGPCYTSLQECHPVPVRDIREHHDDWPEFCPIAERHGLLAALGLPLVLDNRRVGSLNAYNSEPREWTDESISAGTVLADIAAAYILNASELERTRRTAQQLQAALDSRIVIEQAKGKLSGQLEISPDDAFHAIRRYARSHSVTVRAVAQSVLDRGVDAIRDSL